MKDFIKNLGWFLLPEKVMAYDKQKHAARGGFVGLVALVLSLEIGISLFFSVLIALAVVFTVSFLNELRQKKMKDRHYDIKDVYAEMFGGTVIITIVTLLILIK